VNTTEAGVWNVVGLTVNQDGSVPDTVTGTATPLVETDTEAVAAFLEPTLEESETALLETRRVGAAVAPAWLTLALRPPADTVPLREEDAKLAPTVNEKLPGPLRAALLLRVSQEALVVGVHEHPDPVETLTVKDPPALAALTELGLNE
jgi:hypothetical protein